MFSVIYVFTWIMFPDCYPGGDSYPGIVLDYLHSMAYLSLFDPPKLPLAHIDTCYPCVAMGEKVFDVGTLGYLTLLSILVAYWLQTASVIH